MPTQRPSKGGPVPKGSRTGGLTVSVETVAIVKALPPLEEEA